jgi:hypothetical protein
MSPTIARFQCSGHLAVLWLCVLKVCLYGAVCARAEGTLSSVGRRAPVAHDARSPALDFPAREFRMRTSPFRAQVQRLRGGSTAAQSPGEGRGLLVLDIGSQTTRAAMSALPGFHVQGLSSEGLPVLVQNDMSKLDTPTAVSFRGRKCEVGELAADQPVSNVHNTVAGFMPHLGLDENALSNHRITPAFTPAAFAAGRTTAAVVEYKDEVMPLALELAVALQIGAMAQYATAQVASQGGKTGAAPPRFELALAVPTYFTARQIRALQDASAIAGFSARPVLVSAADALAHEYTWRHQVGVLPRFHLAMLQSCHDIYTRAGGPQGGAQGLRHRCAARAVCRRRAWQRSSGASSLHPLRGGRSGGRGGGGHAQGAGGGSRGGSGGRVCG